MPQVGYRGGLGIAGWVALATAGWKHAVGAGLALGATGLWAALFPSLRKASRLE